MQRFLQFRLGCHGLSIATDRLAGAGHVDRANYNRDTMRSLFAQQDHLGVSNYVIDCLNCMSI